MDLAYAAAYRTLWERHWWWRSREGFVRFWLDRLAQTGHLGKILDVGCGDGLFFDTLSQYGEVEGLEPNGHPGPESRWSDRIHPGRLDTSFRPAQPFDLALMLDVLEHIEDDQAALESLRSGLKPGGRLLLTVPAHPWLWSRHDEVNEHFRRYTQRGLLFVLNRSGFEVEILRPFFAWTVLPMVARRILAPATAAAGEYSVTIPPEPINRLLTRISQAEHALTTRVRFPWGSSLFALARVAETALA